MKIILLGPAYPYRGGLAAFNERLAREFQAMGHEVELWTFTSQYPGFLFPGKTQYVEGGQAPSDLAIKRCLHSTWPLNWWQQGRALAAASAERIICPYWLGFMAPALGTVLRPALRGGHSRVIGLIHNLLPHEPRPGDAWFARYFLRSLHAAMLLSRSVAEQVRALGLADLPLACIPHPVYDHYGQALPKAEARQALGLEPGQKTLLFFGFIRAYKGLDVLLQALADPRLAAVKLIVAGEFYGNEAEYRALIERLGLAERLVLHTRFIPDAEVAGFFSAADLVVQPYRSATQSGVTQMAYHFNRPSLVTKVGGLPELVEHGQSGYVVEPENPGAIAEAVLDFYAANREAEFSSRVQTLAQGYTWRALAEGFLAL